MIQIRFVYRDSQNKLYSDKPAKIILPLPLPHQIENGTDMRTIKDAIMFLQQREIPKRLWNVENNQVKAVHTVCRNGLESQEEEGPLFAIFDNDVIAYSMVPDEDYIIVTCHQDESDVANKNNVGCDDTTEAMKEMQTQTTKNTTTRDSLVVENNSADTNTTLAVANVNDTTPPKNQVTPMQTLLDNQATDLPSANARLSRNQDDNHASIELQVPLLTTQKRTDFALESNVTANAKKKKVDLQTTDQILESPNGNVDISGTSTGQISFSKTASKRTESTQESDTVTGSQSIVHIALPTVQIGEDPTPTSDIAQDSPNVVQGSLSKASKRRESTPEYNVEIEINTNMSKVGTLTDTPDGQTNKDSESLFQSTWDECFQQLKLFYDKHGHSQIQKSHRILGAFASQLKMKSIRDKLTEKQEEDLASVKFDMFNKTIYTRQEKSNKQWMERFDMLKQYKMKHGHIMVRRMEDRDLYQWITTQRNLKNNSELQKDRMKLLEEIGFQWESSCVGNRSLLQSSKHTESTQESDPATDPSSIDQVPLPIAPKCKDFVAENGVEEKSISVVSKESTPESDTATESNKSVIGTQTETLDRKTHAKSNNNSVRDKPTDTQKEDLAYVKYHALFPRRNKNDMRWMERFHRLTEYKKKNGHMRVLGFEDKDLNQWMSNQRTHKRKNKLREDRVKLLEEIGFRWESEYRQISRERGMNTNNTSREQMSSLTAQTRIESTPEIDTTTDSTSIEHASLSTVSKRKESDTLERDSATESKKLKVGKQSDQNQESLAEDTIISASKEQSLLSIASKRKESTLESDIAKASKMLNVERQTHQKQEKLSAGTISNTCIAQASLSERWMEKYHELKKYKKTCGHTTVVMSQNKDLYLWMANQRDLKRNYELCENRLKLLEEIGFEWNIRRTRKEFSDKRWMDKFDKLKEYKKNHGHAKVRRSQDKDLYLWLATQRYKKKCNDLSQDRVKLLEDLGILWEKDMSLTKKSGEQKKSGEKKKSGEQKKTRHYHEQWMQNYYKLKAFKKEHGHLKVQESQDRVLARWTYNQRAFKRRGIMYENRVKLLEDIGFIWDTRLAKKKDENLSVAKDVSVPKQTPQKMNSPSPPSLKEIERSSSKKRKRATDNDDIQSHKFQVPVPKKLPKTLALPTDPKYLNKLHQFVRSDLLEIIQENHNIGLQCKFCKTSPEPQSMSKVFPQCLGNKTSGLYRAVCGWQRLHFKQCTQIPDAVKKKYDALKMADTSRGKVQYWEDSAKQIGLFNKEEGGIGFIGDTNDENSKLELERE